MAAQYKLKEEKPPGLKSLSYDQLFFIGYAQVNKDILRSFNVCTDYGYKMVSKGVVVSFELSLDVLCQCSFDYPLNISCLFASNFNTSIRKMTFI